MFYLLKLLEYRYDTFTAFVQLQQLFLKPTIEYIRSTSRKRDSMASLKKKKEVVRVIQELHKSCKRITSPPNQSR
jgi:hypothetical protein